MAGSATITGRQNYVLGIGHPKNEAPTEGAPAVFSADGKSLVGVNGGMVPFGTHIQPEDFPATSYLEGITAWHSGDQYGSNVNPLDLVDTSSWTQTYYVDGVGGNDANNGTSWALRKKSIGNAMRAASASGLPSRILVWAQANLPYYRGISAGDDGLVRASAVPILLEAMNGRVKTGPFDNLTWTKTGGLTYTYQATRSGASRCFNTKQLNDKDLYTEYTWAASSSAVDALEGSWFTDGTTVYVHPHGHDEADIFSARVYLVAKGLEWQSNQNLVVRGFDFEGGNNGAIKVFGGSTNTIVSDDSTYRYTTASNTYTGGTAVIDCAQILGCGLFAAFDSKADASQKDGFNLHAESSVIPSGLFVNCSGTLNGVNPSVSNNGFTTHDGVKSISIGCDWRGNYGTGSGHVDTGTRVWSVGDISGASMGDVIFGGAINYAGFAVWSGAPSMWLDSCRDVGAQYGLWQADSASLNIRNYSGSGRRSGVIGSY